MKDSSIPDVALLLPDLRPGGAERVVVNLCKEFAQRGLVVDLVLMQRRGELLANVHQSVRIIDLASPRVRNCVWPLATYLSTHQPDVLVANMWPLPVVAQLASKWCGSRTRVFGVEHTTWSSSELFEKPLTRTQIKLSMRAIYPSLSGLITVSHGAAEDLTRVSGVPRERINTIYNPIVVASPPSEGGASLPAAWGVGAHDRVLAVGTLKPIKDFPSLLRAFARLRETRDARLLILGEGEERSRLEDLMAALGLGDAVFMPGFTADTRLSYASADLFLLSSRGEGFGNVIVEALEQGTPVVSTDCHSGPREILEDGKYGTLTPVGDVEALAKAMEDALSREHDREALKRRAQDFSVDRAADAYLDLLLPGWRERAAT